MMNDLRRLLVRAFERTERQADISWRQKSYEVSRQLISLRLNDRGRSAVSPTSPELIKLTPFGRQNESKLRGFEFVKIHDGHN